MKVPYLEHSLGVHLLEQTDNAPLQWEITYLCSLTSVRAFVKKKNKPVQNVYFTEVSEF